MVSWKAVSKTAIFVIFGKSFWQISIHLMFTGLCSGARSLSVLSFLRICGVILVGLVNISHQ